MSAWWLLGWGAAVGYVLAKVEETVRHWRGERTRTAAHRLEQARLWRQYGAAMAGEHKERQHG